MYCECGCGEVTTIITATNKNLGRFRGRHNRFISGHNMPSGTGTGWYFDHTKNRMYVIGRDLKRYAYYRIVAGNTLGRELRVNETVHHKNHDSTDDRAENLEVMSRAEHARLHQMGNTGRWHDIAA